ncbi:MAG TPA: sugar kinase [Terriglobales bacterium]|nr:sugar kinase [Terriglobales bacterium]
MPQFDITIAGELNLDLILYGVPEELAREREFLAKDMMLTLGGSSSILAHNLAALGQKVGFVSAIGADQFGEIGAARLREAGVDTSCIKVLPGSKTGLTVILQREQWRNMVTYSGTIAELKWEHLDLEYLKSSRHFHLSSFYLQTGLQPHIPELFKIMKESGLSTSLDTNDDPDDRWQGGLLETLRYVDLFMPNEREACRIAGTSDLEQAVSWLAQQVPLVVVKCGKRGAIAQKGSERITREACEVTVVDAVGAGDSFDAGFLSRFVRGDDVVACLAEGNRVGAFSTTCAGGTEAFRNGENLRKLRENPA